MRCCYFTPLHASHFAKGAERRKISQLCPGVQETRHCRSGEISALGNLRCPGRCCSCSCCVIMLMALCPPGGIEVRVRNIKTLLLQSRHVTLIFHRTSFFFSPQIASTAFVDSFLLVYCFQPLDQTFLLYVLQTNL